MTFTISDSTLTFRGTDTADKFKIVRLSHALKTVSGAHSVDLSGFGSLTLKLVTIDAPGFPLPIVKGLSRGAAS